MRTRQGDKVAYKKLLTELTPFIRRVVGGRAMRWGQKDCVEDVTQETLLAIHLKLHTYDETQAFLPWLHSVARYKLIDYLRRNNRASTVSLDDEGTAEPEDPASYQDATASRDLSKLLQQLKPPAGEIIHALKVEGATVREVATKFKLSETNVKVIVHRGLEKLAKFVLLERVTTS